MAQLTVYMCGTRRGTPQMDWNQPGDVMQPTWRALQGQPCPAEESLRLCRAATMTSLANMRQAEAAARAVGGARLERASKWGQRPPAHAQHTHTQTPRVRVALGAPRAACPVLSFILAKVLRTQCAPPHAHARRPSSCVVRAPSCRAAPPCRRGACVVPSLIRVRLMRAPSCRAAPPCRRGMVRGPAQ